MIDRDAKQFLQEGVIMADYTVAEQTKLQSNEDYMIDKFLDKYDKHPCEIAHMWREHQLSDDINIHIDPDTMTKEHYLYGIWCLSERNSDRPWYHSKDIPSVRKILALERNKVWSQLDGIFQDEIESSGIGYVADLVDKLSELGVDDTAQQSLKADKGLETKASSSDEDKLGVDDWILIGGSSSTSWVKVD